MRKLIRIICVISAVLCVAAMSFTAYASVTLPDEYIVIEDSRFELKSFIFFSDDTKNEPKAKTAAALSGRETGREAEIKLLGVIPVKTVSLKERAREYVLVGGELFGLRMYTDGVLIVGTENVESVLGVICPASGAGLMTGDIIRKIDGREVNRVAQVSDAVAESGGAKLKFTVERSGTVVETVLTPAVSTDGGLRAGLWLRDSSAGLGTMTFIDPDTGIYGGLGHPVCDVDTGEILPVESGDMLSAVIHCCYKSVNGTAGEICGSFGDEELGDIRLNCSAGIFGKYDDAENLTEGTLLPVACRQEIRTGKAQVITSTDSAGKKVYDIEIVSINTAAPGDEKNMVISITDTALLAKTGGIVQGMSGSPIIQDGMLVGAVTHVFLNDCTEGYAIFAENMLETGLELAG